MGRLSEWDCDASENELNPGNLLVLYTDEIIRVENQRGEHLNLCQREEALGRHRKHAYRTLYHDLFKEIYILPDENYNQDDITLAVLKVREHPTKLTIRREDLLPTKPAPIAIVQLVVAKAVAEERDRARFGIEGVNDIAVQLGKLLEERHQTFGVSHRIDFERTVGQRHRENLKVDVWGLFTLRKPRLKPVSIFENDRVRTTAHSLKPPTLFYRRS
ncbi:MAG: serine/threonine-protein phosphatase [Planctomycetes bacterium]|nr:serine/threonine-protein phosphatase [Planctomycetota bacterium]